jgi:hypothetical protein
MRDAIKHNANKNKALNEAEKQMFFFKGPHDVNSYLFDLKRRLKKFGLPEDAFNIDYTHVSTFNPSEQEFLKMLKIWKLIK